MFNIGGGEVLVIALIALIVVGPEQLPSVLRKAGRYVTQFRTATTSIRQEFMSGIDELDPTKWDEQGTGTNDSPIVPRGFAGQKSDTAPGAGIKPVSAPMGGVDPEPGAGANPIAFQNESTNSIANANSSANLSASRAAERAAAAEAKAAEDAATDHGADSVTAEQSAQPESAEPKVAESKPAESKVVEAPTSSGGSAAEVTAEAVADELEDGDAS